MMIKSSRSIALRRSSVCKRCCGFAAALLIVALLVSGSAMARDDWYRTVGGLSVYLGIVPAEIVNGPSFDVRERSMHGGASGRSHEYHVVAAVYESASKARVSDATVTAKASGLGLSGYEKTLEPMKIADTITYGGFFNLPTDLYTIRLTVQRPGSKPVTMDFKFDHRRR